MKGLDMAAANANPDPFLLACYPNVTKSENTGVILEIRRERTIELVMEGLRMWDMFRWKEGAQLVNETNPYYGIYFSGPGLYDMDGDGRNDLELYVDKQPSRRIDGTAHRIGHHSLRHGGKPRLRGGVEYAEIHLERGTRLPVAHSGRPARTDGRTADPESRMDRQHRFRLTLSQPDKIKRQ